MQEWLKSAHQRTALRSAMNKLFRLVFVGVFAAGAACSTEETGTSRPSTTKQGSTSTEAATPSDAPATKFTVLAYNVAGLPEGISGSHPKVNTPLIAPKLNDFDITLLQETWRLPDDMSTVPEALRGFELYHSILQEASTHPYRTDDPTLPLGSLPDRRSALVSDGLAIFSNYKILEQVRVPWAECEGEGTQHGGDCLATKGFLWTRMELDSELTMDVVSLHVEAGSSPRDQELQDADMKLLADYLNEHSQKTALIVGGDFNLHTDEPEDDALYQTFIKAVGLEDVCELTKCGDLSRIDKVAIRSSDAVKLTATGWDLLDTEFTAPDGEGLSDHDPVLAQLTWAPAE